jgi:hypothetical protein
MEDPFSYKQLFWYFLKSTLCIAFAIPFVLFGAALCTVVVFIPIGVPLFWIGVRPFVVLQRHRVAKLIDWREFREHEPPPIENPPWII